MNYYDVLGVPKGANEKEVRQAYRRLARQHHPDVNAGDRSAEERFKQINEAYSVLSDPEKRRKYDRYGDNWRQADQMGEAEAQARRRGNSRWSSTGGREASSGSGGGSDDLFDQLFQNMGQDPPHTASEHLVEITLEEADRGTTRLLEPPGGRRLEVKIPPGVDSGSRVHLPRGGGRQGDIYLVVSVQPHPQFRRQARDLYCEVPVSLEDAVLGGEVTVPTLRGRVSLAIPPETQNGQRFRLAGQGMPTLDQPDLRGDLYATVSVKLPTSLTAQQRALFQQLKELRAPRRS
jgi:DnaJ-class molecular chaperone